MKNSMTTSNIFGEVETKEITAKIDKLNKNTASAYEIVKSDFNNHLRSSHDIISKESISSFMQSVRNSFSAKTYNQRRSLLKELLLKQYSGGDMVSSFARFRIDEIFSSIKRIKDGENTEPIHLNKEQINQMISCTSKRYGLMIRFFYLTGVRVSELINIRLVDIVSDQQPENYKIKIVGKGNKSRDIFAPRELVEHIKIRFNSKVYLFETLKEGEQYNRVNVTRSITRIGKKAFGDKIQISAHTLRHSFSMQLFNNGIDAKRIQQLLGHSSTSTTLDMYVNCKANSKHLELFTE